MARIGRPQAKGWRLLSALLWALAAVAARAEVMEEALEDENDPTLTAQALRQNNNNPITARRRALRSNLNNVLQLMPGSLRPLYDQMPEPERVKLGGPEAFGQLNTEYTLRLAELVEMRDKVSKRMYGSTLGKLEDRYPALRDEMFSMLYKVTAYRFYNDPVRFKEYTQKQLDIAVAIRDTAKDRRLSEQRLAILRRWQGELGGYPSIERLHEIYDGIGARQVDDQQLVITTAVRPRTNQSAAVLGVNITEFKPRPPSTRTAEVPSPVITRRPTGPQTTPAPRQPTIPDTADELSGSEFAAFMRTNAPSRASARRVFTSVIGSVEKWSDRFNLNPLLVMSFMGQESLFVGWERAVSVKSYAGAQGLMQLMPATARSLGVSDRTNIDQNIMGGAKYIKDQRNQFSSEAQFRRLDAIMKWGAEQVVHAQRSFDSVWGEVWRMVPMEVKNAIAAYNSGPGRIRQFGSYANLPKWLQQTIDYVPGVLQKYLRHAVDYERTQGPRQQLQIAAIEPRVVPAPNAPPLIRTPTVRPLTGAR